MHLTTAGIHCGFKQGWSPFPLDVRSDMPTLIVEELVLLTHALLQNLQCGYEGEDGEDPSEVGRLPLHNISL